jgi:hypothetical protein
MIDTLPYETIELAKLAVELAKLNASTDPTQYMTPAVELIELSIKTIRDWEKAHGAGAAARRAAEEAEQKLAGAMNAGLEADQPFK